MNTGMAQSLPSPMGTQQQPMMTQQQPMMTQQQPMAQDNTAQYCSVALPEKQPMMSRDSAIARRVFIVSHPERFPDDVLRDAFCRFGNLIDAYFVPGEWITSCARYLKLVGCVFQFQFSVSLRTRFGSEFPDDATFYIQLLPSPSPYLLHQVFLGLSYSCMLSAQVCST